MNYKLIITLCNHCSTLERYKEFDNFLLKRYTGKWERKYKDRKALINDLKKMGCWWCYFMTRSNGKLYGKGIDNTVVVCQKPKYTRKLDYCNNCEIRFNCKTQKW